MSGIVFASGGGNAQNSFLLDQAFVKALKRHTVLYIPIGLKRDIIGFEKCYDWITTTLGKHASGTLDIDMWTNLAGKDEEKLNGFDAIYIGGASNSFRLMDLLHRTGLDNKIASFVNSGGCVYGGSSGAIVLGRSLASWGEEQLSIADSSGLDLIAGLSLFCHYSPNTEARLASFLKTYQLPTVALPENAGLIYYRDESIIQTVGYSPTKLFSAVRSPTSLPPGTTFNVRKWLIHANVK